MSILRNDVGMAEMEAVPCKRDWESVIRSHSDQLGKNLALQKAIFEYQGYHMGDALYRLIGELICEERSLNEQITYALKKQEEEN